MVLRKLRLLSKQVLVIIIFLQLSPCRSQQLVSIDTIKFNLFTNKLQAINFSEIEFKDSPIIVITLMNCSGCVNYFISHKKSFSFIFEIQNKSILEINRIIALYNLKDSDKILFLVSNKSAKNLLIKEPSPQIIFRKEEKNYHLNYSEVVALTNDFTLKPKKIKPIIKRITANPITISDN